MAWSYRHGLMASSWPQRKLQFVHGVAGRWIIARRGRPGEARLRWPMPLWILPMQRDDSRGEIQEDADDIRVTS